MRGRTRAVLSTLNMCTGCHCVVLLLLICICSVNSEKLQCLEEHILLGEKLEGLNNGEHCKLESRGPKLNSSICTVWDFGDGYEDCQNLQFADSASNSMKDIRITPYLEPNMNTANFNITFTDVQWRYMQYRIQVGRDNSLCHRLKLEPTDALSSGKQQPLSLSFACNNFGSWAAGRQAEMQVEVGMSPEHISSHAHYQLMVPINRKLVDFPNSTISINDWLIAIVVEKTHRPNLVVSWPAVPERFNVSSYRLQATGEKARDVGPSFCHDGYCSFEYFAGYNARNVSFSVQPVHEDCQESCFSFSPTVALEFSLPFYLILMMACVPILIVLVCCCSIYFFCCIPPREPPTVLLLHDATERNHCRVVRLLAEFLEQEGGILCLQPDVEIPRTESQNPLKWLNKVVDEVDVVLVVASPENLLDIRFCEYPNVLYDALSLIKQRRECPAHDRAGRFLVAIPPYCSEENVLPSVKDLPRIAIPQEMGWLLWSLYNQHCWMPPFTWMAKLCLRLCCCPGPVSAYRRQGQRLDEALQDAVAARQLAERAPHTPLSSRRTDWTWRNPPAEENDSVSVQNGKYPGNINNLNLMPLLEGSIASEGSTFVPMSDIKTAINLDSLPLG